MKRKGSSLIMVLCVVALLSALTLILVTGATSAYNLTTTNDKNDKVYLMAESGVEMGLCKIKETLATSPSTIYGSGELSSLNFNFNGDDATRTVSFKNRVDSIEVQSSATQKGKTKTIVATILKEDIKNPYYDFLKNNILTTLDKMGTNGESFSAKYNNSPIHANGNMYLQGSNIYFAPGCFTEYNNININANKITMDILNSTLRDWFSGVLGKFTVNNTIKTYTSTFPNGVFSYEDKDLHESLMAHTFKKPPKVYDKLGVANNKLSEFDFYLNVSGAEVGVKTIKDDNGDDCFMAVVKMKGNCNFPFIQRDVELAVYNKFKDDYISSHSADFLLEEALIEGKAIIDATKKVKDIVKVYLIDGNVTVYAMELPYNIGISPQFGNFIDNSIIYSTGGVNIGSKWGIDGLDSLYFNNCTIMTKQVKFNDLSLFGTSFTSNFSEKFYNINKLVLSDVFAKNFVGYSDAYEFKIHSWAER